MKSPVGWETEGVSTVLMMLIWEQRYPGGHSVSLLLKHRVPTGVSSVVVWAAWARVTPFLSVLTAQESWF